MTAALIERLEKAEATGDREIDAELWLMFTPGATRKESVVKSSKGLWPDYTIDETREASGRLIVVPAYTTSLDAALALAERVRIAPYTGPISLTIAGSGQAYIDHIDPCGMGVQAFGRTPALALCLAILKARTAAEPGSVGTQSEGRSAPKAVPSVPAGGVG